MFIAPVLQIHFETLPNSLTNTLPNSLTNTLPNSLTNTLTNVLHLTIRCVKIREKSY